MPNPNAPSLDSSPSTRLRTSFRWYAKDDTLVIPGGQRETRNPDASSFCPHAERATCWGAHNDLTMRFLRQPLKYSLRPFQVLSPNDRASGFTLLELLLVLVIVAIAATLVAPAIGNRFTTADPRQVIVQLRAAMELMRVRAIEDGKEEVLVVAPEDGRYWHEEGEVSIPPESGELTALGRFTRETGEVEFHFYPDGTNSGGEVRIEKPRSEGGKAYGLMLNPLLGTATIRRDN
jgi:general secretion pathway protein H